MNIHCATFKGIFKRGCTVMSTTMYDHVYITCINFNYHLQESIHFTKLNAENTY